MPLNKQKGNMYGFVTHTWNTVKGKCYHDCSYCYMKRWKDLPEIHFDEKELRTNLGKNNYIFVGSSNDIFAENIPEQWILDTFKHCSDYQNKYLFQTKNPKKACQYLPEMPTPSSLCVTLETNRYYPEFMADSPSPRDRVEAILTAQLELKKYKIPLMITIEPVMAFDLRAMEEILTLLNPEQINIGADSARSKNMLKEPTKHDLETLIDMIEYHKFNLVKKSNLKRLLR